MYLDQISQLLKQASQIAKKNFGKIVTSETKKTDNNQVLTQTDLEIGKYLVDQIKVIFEGYNIIDEEAGVIDNKSRFTWTVDPIDGTSNFANGIPTYGIILGLLDENKPIAGGIALPSFDSIYVAESGKGAFLGNKQISCTKENNLLNSLISYGIDGHQEEPSLTHRETKILSNIILGIRNLRTSNSAYDFALVADGRYGAYLNQTSKIWDNVGAQILIEEAGGIYTDFYGNPMDYQNPISKARANFTYCAASSELHAQLQSIINLQGVTL